jgi:hypothetical protein
MGLTEHGKTKRVTAPMPPFSPSLPHPYPPQTTPQVLCGRTTHRHCDQDTASVKPHCLIASGHFAAGAAEKPSITTGVWDLTCGIWLADYRKDTLWSGLELYLLVLFSLQFEASIQPHVQATRVDGKRYSSASISRHAKATLPIRNTFPPMTASG